MLPLENIVAQTNTILRRRTAAPGEELIMAQGSQQIQSESSRRRHCASEENGVRADVASHAIMAASGIRRTSRIRRPPDSSPSLGCEL
jgi:hypothetical protein